MTEAAPAAPVDIVLRHAVIERPLKTHVAASNMEEVEAEGNRLLDVQRLAAMSRRGPRWRQRKEGLGNRLVHTSVWEVVRHWMMMSTATNTLTRAWSHHLAVDNTRTMVVGEAPAAPEYHHGVYHQGTATGGHSRAQHITAPR